LRRAESSSNGQLGARQPDGAAEDLHPVLRYNHSMNRSAQEILEDARKLPPDEVNWLIENLLHDGEVEPEALVEAAWDREIKRRLDEIDSGAVEAVPLEDVLARMDARIASRQRE
jgi:putative addiction module component (TIGR02574 family)